jgi:hypothetical protein
VIGPRACRWCARRLVNASPCTTTGHTGYFERYALASTSSLDSSVTLRACPSITRSSSSLLAVTLHRESWARFLPLRALALVVVYKDPSNQTASRAGREVGHPGGWLPARSSGSLLTVAGRPPTGSRSSPRPSATWRGWVPLHSSSRSSGRGFGNVVTDSWAPNRPPEHSAQESSGDMLFNGLLGLWRADCPRCRGSTRRAH